MRLTLASTPLVSFLISTHNRRDSLLRTLERIDACGLATSDYEVVVVDNASTDGTAAAITARFGGVRLIRLRRNRGACAKNVGLEHANGQYVVFLDDDSYPAPGSIARMIEHFDRDPRLGAAVFTVTLTDGSQECSAYPNVFIGCGTGFRRRVVEMVGGLPDDYFMQAEEYDLSLRIMDAGWDVRRFADLHVTHLKSPTARKSSRMTRLDVRNNIMLAMRRLPPQWAVMFAQDWTRRYHCIAEGKGHQAAYWLGVFGGVGRALRVWKRRPIDDWTFEAFARIEETERRLRRAQEQHDLQTVLFLDYGKAILPYYLAARKLGIEVVAVADDRLARPRREYRDIPVLTTAAARKLAFDAAIVSNLSPVHAQARLAAWSARDIRPAIDLYDSARYAEPSSGVVLAGPAIHRTAARIA